MQPMNQMTERADREVSLGIEQTFGNALRELIIDPNWQALFTFRIGYPFIEGLAYLCVHYSLMLMSVDFDLSCYINI
jgi:hypothetical protein